MISEWAMRLNMTVKRCEERPDQPPGEIVYRLKDLFTTQSGSWEPSGGIGAVPDWARQSYLRPLGAPDFFDDAGADHHLFARVLDMEGRPLTAENSILFWSDGFHKLSDPNYRDYVRLTPKAHSGWANQPVFNSFNPERGEQGAWCWCPTGAADVVIGGGLPNNQHVSTFAVWQAERRQPVVTPERPVTEPAPEPIPGPGRGGDPSPADAPLAEMRRALWDQLRIPFNRDSSFAAYARERQLGAPLTTEIDVGNFRVQGFASAIVYATIGQWHAIRHIEW